MFKTPLFFACYHNKIPVLVTVLARHAVSYS